MADAKSLVCRLIEDKDVPQAVDLLTEGFRGQRRRRFWQRALSRLANHDTPPGLPRFGYALEANGKLVGVILLISTRLRTGGAETLRCNLSSWYVTEPYRVFAPMLIARALRHREATYINLTAVPHTFKILAAQGFHRYVEGRLITVPALSRGPGAAKVTAYRPGAADGLSMAEQMLLADHARWGCVSLVVRHGTQTHPFVFAPRRRFGTVGMALLAYCRDVADFVRFAGPIGRFLLRRGLVLVAVDADGKLPGLVGHFTPNKPKFFRGPDRPRPGDLSYSERTMFGS